MDATMRTIEALRFNIDRITNEVVKRQLVGTNFSELQKEASLRDSKYNIEQLANAIELGSVELFNDYLIWLRDVLRASNLEDRMLIQHLKYIREFMEEYFDEKMVEIIDPFIEEGIKSIEEGHGESESYLSAAGEFESLARSYYDLLIYMKRDEAIVLIMAAVETGKISVEDLYLKVFTNVLYEIGRMWVKRKISVGQEHYATAVTVYTMSLLYGKIFTAKEKVYKMIGICVGEELHEIGIRMVCDIFEMQEWDTYYLGANVPIETILDEMDRIAPNLIAISVTMVGKVTQSKLVIERIRSANKGVKVIVGGRPFNADENLWQQVGADGYSRDADEAVKVARKLMR